MLIIIDDTIINLIENKPSIAVINSIEKISASCIRGNHVFYANRNVFKSLKNCISLSEAARYTFTRMYNRFSVMKSYLDVVSKVVRISDIKDISLSKDGDFEVINIPISKIDTSSVLEKTIILSENLEDINIYKKIIEFYSYYNDIEFINVSFEEQGGGGSTLGNNFAIIQERNDRLCLCLSDSDKSSPDSALGSTANRLKSVNNKRQYLSFPVIANIREIENYIPLEIYENLLIKFNDDQNRLETINLLKNIRNKSNVLGVFFFDIKKGISLSVVNANKTKPESEFWRKIFDDLNISTVCTSETTCTKRDNCKCIIAQGLGDGILRRAISEIQPMDTSIIKEYLQDYLLSEWNTLGKVLLDWGCCTSPIRA